MAAMLAARAVWSRAASIGSRRVAVLLGPTTSPDQIGPAKKAWGRGFAEHGFVDGKEIEIAIYRGPSMDYMRAGAADWERVARQAVDSRPALMVMAGVFLSFVRRLTRDIPHSCSDLSTHRGRHRAPAKRGDRGRELLVDLG